MQSAAVFHYLKWSKKPHSILFSASFSSSWHWLCFKLLYSLPYISLVQCQYNFWLLYIVLGLLRLTVTLWLVLVMWIQDTVSRSKNRVMKQEPWFLRFATLMKHFGLIILGTQGWRRTGLSIRKALWPWLKSCLYGPEESRPHTLPSPASAEAAGFVQSVLLSFDPWVGRFSCFASLKSSSAFFQSCTVAMSHMQLFKF